FLLRSSAAVASLVASGHLLQGDTPDRLPDGSVARGMITPEAQTAINKGLAYLAARQASDGSFGEPLQYRGNVAITRLAALAMMAGGHQPGRGKYGKVVTSALEYVLDQEDSAIPGFLHRKSGMRHEHGPMYGHGFGTLFLAEVYGMVPNKELRERLQGTL